MVASIQMHVCQNMHGFSFLKQFPIHVSRGKQSVHVLLSLFRAGLSVVKEIFCMRKRECAGCATEVKRTG